MKKESTKEEGVGWEKTVELAQRDALKRNLSRGTHQTQKADDLI